MTGGYNNGAHCCRLDYTEIMEDFSSWEFANRLPSVNTGVKVATLDNKVFAFGN